MFVLPPGSLAILHAIPIYRVLLRLHIQAFKIRRCHQLNFLPDINSPSCVHKYYKCLDLCGHSLFPAAAPCLFAAHDAEVEPGLCNEETSLSFGVFSASCSS